MSPQDMESKDEAHKLWKEYNRKKASGSRSGQLALVIGGIVALLVIVIGLYIVTL